jgi:ribosomal protein L11 methylase PrmA
MKKYKKLLNVKGHIIVSGFLTPDTDIILQTAKELKLIPSQTKENNGWVSIILNTTI